MSQVGGSCLGANESSVEAACDGRVGGSLDDGAAVGEESHLVSVAPEFQDEIIVLDHAVRLKTERHLRK